MRSTVAARSATLLLIAACGGGDGGAATEAVTRDSAGVSIVEYPAGAWDQAARWQLSAEPMAVVGGDASDTDLDLSNSGLATMLADHRIVAATTIAPAQIYIFAADGSSRATIGRSGEGPGEYRVITALTRLGGDTIAVYDLAARKALLFTADGAEAGRIQLPFAGDATQPPQLLGRAADGTWVFRTFDQLNMPPEGAPDQFRKAVTITKWRAGGERLDSMLTVQGPLSIRSTVDFGGQSIPIGRPLAYGANSSQAVSGSTLWSTPGDVFVLQAYNLDGTLVREVRVPTEPHLVTPAQQEVFKQRQREGLERARGFGAPPALIESELAKIDAMPFAEHHGAIGQLTVDNVGRLWATTGTPIVDSILTYGVFSPNGELLGRVTLPGGIVLGASEDRVVIRREDEATGLVRLEIWGLLPVCEECDAPSK